MNYRNLYNIRYPKVEMVLVVNGEGYDSLVDAYEQGIIEPGFEIITSIKGKRRLFAKPPWTGGIVFNKKGILYRVNHGSERLGTKTSLERLSVEELKRIGKWGAPAKPLREKATA